MRKLSFAVLCGFGILSLAGVTRAQAQVYGTDYIAFKGAGTVLDNPPTAACQAIGITFGARYTVTYRFTANPGLIADAITIMSQSHAIHRIVSTQSPNFSLNGAMPHNFVSIFSVSNFASGSSTSTLTIASGINGPVGLGTGNMKITNGQINEFFGNGCNIANFRAAMVVLPNN